MFRSLPSQRIKLCEGNDLNIAFTKNKTLLDENVFVKCALFKISTCI